MTKVLPSASQSALVSETVTLASVDRSSSVQATPSQVRPAAGDTVNSWVVLPAAASSSVAVRVTVTEVSSVTE